MMSKIILFFVGTFTTTNASYNYYDEHKGQQQQQQQQQNQQHNLQNFQKFTASDHLPQQQTYYENPDYHRTIKNSQLNLQQNLEKQSTKFLPLQTKSGNNQGYEENSSNNIPSLSSQSSIGPGTVTKTTSTAYVIPSSKLNQENAIQQYTSNLYGQNFNLPSELTTKFYTSQSFLPKFYIPGKEQSTDLNRILVNQHNFHYNSNSNSNSNNNNNDDDVDDGSDDRYEQVLASPKQLLSTSSSSQLTSGFNFNPHPYQTEKSINYKQYLPYTNEQYEVSNSPTNGYYTKQYSFSNNQVKQLNDDEKLQNLMLEYTTFIQNQLENSQRNNIKEQNQQNQLQEPSVHQYHQQPNLLDPLVHYHSNGVFNSASPSNAYDLDPSGGYGVRPEKFEQQKPDFHHPSDQQQDSIENESNAAKNNYSNQQQYQQNTFQQESKNHDQQNQLISFPSQQDEQQATSAQFRSNAVEQLSNVNLENGTADDDDGDLNKYNFARQNFLDYSNQNSQINGDNKILTSYYQPQEININVKPSETPNEHLTKTSTTMNLKNTHPSTTVTRYSYYNPLHRYPLAIYPGSPIPPPPHTQHFHHHKLPYSKHVNVQVTRHIPIPIYRQIHVPVKRPVNIKIPHPIVVPVPKPVPIQIPVSKAVAVPMVQEIKLPIEKIVPVPVEKKVPYTVEKHVPYTVEKNIRIPIIKPYPVKVPIIKTILHEPHKPHHHYNHHHHPYSHYGNYYY